jgi:hypothetical protein
MCFSQGELCLKSCLVNHKIITLDKLIGVTVKTYFCNYLKLKSFFILFLFCTFTFTAHAEIVKQSSSGICHDEYSSYYDRTKNFKSFNTLAKCLNSNGHLPKNYKGNSADNNSDESDSKYSRKHFGSGWADFDKDCQSARMETLISQSIGQIRFKSAKKCNVKSGKWISTFTGNTIFAASEIDIDHVVPLSWAWKHGADDWTKNKRVKFANDPANLLSVELSLNRQKGDKGLDEWLPPKNKCQYISRFLRVYKTYDLQLTSSESAYYATIKKQNCQ